MAEDQIDCGFIADSHGTNSVKLDIHVGNNGLSSVVVDNVYFGP